MGEGSFCVEVVHLAILEASGNHLAAQLPTIGQDALLDLNENR